MPPSNWQKAKKAGTAQHFTLVHRPQNDPRINDESAPSMVLNPTPKSGKVKKLDDLESELGSDAQSIRDNEGEAANYGVYFDDTEYDYMQHMREIGAGGGDAVFVEAKAPLNKEKGKQKQSLEDALQQMELEQKSGELFDEDILPSKDLPRLNYQSQQDVPDALAGFQPDMDPRLREVLEALEDEEYVDDDEDIFQQLSKDAKELNDHEFDETYDDYDGDDGWESDHTAKPNKEYRDDEVPTLVNTAETPEEGPSQDWLEDFKQFKKDQKTDKKPVAPSHMDGQSSIWTTTTMGGRKKKRKGALTNPSTYSMTSSALVRNEQLSILDARFDKMEERYNNDMEDEGSIISGMSSMSSIQGPMRQDFDGILDEFLGTHVMKGKRRVKRGKDQSGVQELDEIRRSLGPARIPGRKA
ncbi:Protein LTV1 [Cytospora mali]|uniref:Protein LTV1 n=1 Tax=Cytospora mali TaxID=578113 RepID=A0A194UYJ2_CYTMA|nr:Protein LTV1 [Valsa mali var. pyri (nom. inval.)]